MYGLTLLHISMLQHGEEEKTLPKTGVARFAIPVASSAFDGINGSSDTVPWQFPNQSWRLQTTSMMVDMRLMGKKSAPVENINITHIINMQFFFVSI